MSEIDTDVEEVTDPLGIDRRGLYYWCNYDQTAPLHSRLNCGGLNRIDAEDKQKYLNEVIIRGNARGLNFCSMCCERGGETPVEGALGETSGHLPSHAEFAKEE